MPDILEELDQDGHLTPRQRQAAALILRHLRASHGSSNGVVGEIAEKVDTSRQPPAWPAGSDGAPIGILDGMLRGLRLHERELVAFSNGSVRCGGRRRHGALARSGRHAPRPGDPARGAADEQHEDKQRKP